MTKSRGVIALDVGGTTSAGSVVSSEREVVGRVHRTSTPGDAPADVLLDSMLSLLTAALDDVGSAIDCIAIGVGMPGPFEYETGVARLRHKFEALYGVNIRCAITSEFDLPVHFVNDADAFALGAWWSEFPDTERLLGVTLGTGIGTGFVIQGSLVSQGHGVPDGAEIYNAPFGDGILEDVVSARAIAALYCACLKSDQPNEVVDIAASARVGDLCAARSFAWFGHDLGSGLAAAASRFRPGRVALGGGIAGAYDLFGLEAERAYRRATGTAIPFLPVTDAQRCSLVGVGAYAFGIVS
ncbi:MAG: ROK family protein [bacterium]|nr:ROK family protein [bacterium]